MRVLGNQEGAAQTSKKLESIQMIRGVACLLVVLYHIAVLSKDYMSGAFLAPALIPFKIGVDLFFVISGVVMIITTWDKFGQPGVAERFAVQRVSRIYPPYWCLALLLTGYYFYNPSGINSENGGVDLFRSFTLLPSKSLPIVPVAWTLTYELLFYIVFWVMLLFVPKKRIISFLVVWGVIIMVGNAVSDRGYQLFAEQKFLFSPFVLEFIAGCFIGILYKTRPMHFSNAAFALGVCLFAVIIGTFQILNLAELKDTSIRVLVFLPISALFVYGCLGLEIKGRFHVNPLFVRLGDASYSIYLLHILVLHFFYRVSAGKISATWETGAAFYIGGTIISICSGYIYFLIVERHVSRFMGGALERGLSAVRRWFTPFPEKPLR